MYTNYPSQNVNYNSYQNYPYLNERNDERFLLAPFLFGGLAGTALGYGIASNNQYNNQPYPIPFYPVYQSYPIYPTYSSNNYYY